MSNPLGGGYVLGRDVGTGTIRNDDGVASGITMGIGDASIVNAKSGTQTLAFDMALSAKATSTVSVAYTVTPGTAAYSVKSTGGGDYGGKTTGTLTFKVGATGFTPLLKTVGIPIWPDANVETNETFTITLSGLNGTGITLIGSTATATILAS